MTIDWTKPVELVAIDGKIKPARVVCTDRKISSFASKPIVVLVYAQENLHENVILADADGSCAYGKFQNIRKKIFLNLYKQHSLDICTPCRSLEAAQNLADSQNGVIGVLELYEDTWEVIAFHKTT